MGINMKCVMRINSDVLVYIYLMLVISTPAGTKTNLSMCKQTSLRTLEKHCNPALGDVITHILAADGQNFTQLCRWVLLRIQGLTVYRKGEREREREKAKQRDRHMNRQNERGEFCVQFHTHIVDA